MHSVVETVLLDIGNIGIDHGNRHKFLTPVEELHVKFWCRCADAGVDELSGLNGRPAEIELSVDDGVAVGKDIRDNLHLCDSLDKDLAAVLPPFPVGQITVDGLAHIACNQLVLGSDVVVE